MILKPADDKSTRVRMLEALQNSNALDARRQTWAKDELYRLRAGIQGEKEAAFYLNNYCKNGANHVLLHDLRILVDDEVAQIDHLVFSRGAGIYLLETKNYSANVEINEHGEFTVFYGRKTFGIPSPIEQSRRHERVLVKLFERLGINARTRKGLDCHHVVMFNPKARIKRPSPKVFDTSMVVKSDQFPEWHKKFAEKDMGPLDVLIGLANLRSLDTLKEWGEMLMRQHRPTDPNELPDFMREAVAMQARPAPRQTPMPDVAKPAPATTPTAAATSAATPEKKLICANCGIKISFPEGKFCWSNPKRFGQLQYCRGHQAAFS